MKRKIERFIRSLNLHKFKYLNKFLLKVFIAISVIIFVLLLKKINIPNTQKILSKIDYGISQDFNIKNQGNKIFKKAEQIIYDSSKFISTFKEDSVDKLSSPINGEIYRPFKSGENEGVDILSMDDKDPLSITSGLVKDIKIDEKKGYFVTIESDDMIITYGYLSKVYVNKGDLINTLDSIGKLGKNKDNNRYLRLEIEVDGKKVNPEKYIEIDNSLST